MVVGPIMAGGIYDATQSYEAAFKVGGSVFILCSVVMALIKPVLVRYPLDKGAAAAAKAEKEAKNNNNNNNPIYSKKLREKSTTPRRSSDNNGKWGNDVGRHLDTLTAIDEEVKLQEQLQEKV